MSTQGNQQDSPLTYLNGDTGVIPSNSLVTLTSTPGSVVCCAADGVPVGIADGDIGMGSYGSFKTMQGRVGVHAASLVAIAAGDFCAADDAGCVKQDTGVALTANTIGQAETAVSGDTGAGVQLFIVCRG
jgi:hypothetical protein